MRRPLLPVTIVLMLVVLVAVVLASARRASAIPTFSREHGLKCSDCHAAFPLLNEFGMEFKQRGFRLPGENGKYPWELKSLPVSVIGTMQYLNVHQDDPVTKARLSTTSEAQIGEVELMSGFWQNSLRTSQREGVLAMSKCGCSSATCCRPVSSTCVRAGC